MQQLDRSPGLQSAPFSCCRLRPLRPVPSFFLLPHCLLLTAAALLRSIWGFHTIAGWFGKCLPASRGSLYRAQSCISAACCRRSPRMYTCERLGENATEFRYTAVGSDISSGSGGTWARAAVAVVGASLFAQVGVVLCFPPQFLRHISSASSTSSSQLVLLILVG